MIVFPSLFSLGSLFQNQLAPHHRNRSVQIRKQSKSNLINLHAQYPSKFFIINHFLFTNHPLPQLLSLSRMHAWKLFRKHQMFSNWICFSSLRRSGPRRTRSAASEEVVTSLGLRWKPNDTCPSLTSLSWHLWELVKFSEDLSWELGNHLWVQKWHHLVRKWNLLKMANVSLPHQLLPVTSS